MNELEQARVKIGEIDAKMCELFEERMHCAKRVAEYKKANGLPILDPSREKALLARNLERVRDAALKPYYAQYQQAVMDVSKRYQHRLLEGARIAYSGIEGAFASIAAQKLFPDGEKVAYRNFSEAFQAVSCGECDAAVLPVENSHSGEVGQVMDLLFAGDLYINGIYPLQISQNLLGVPGSTIENLKTVISHPQALDQCADYISAHDFATIQAVNTASAAKEVAKKRDETVAAIASRETAALYGLTVLDHDINADLNNTTRFAVLTKSRETPIHAEEHNTYILMFTVRNEAGSLARAIHVIGSSGYSMRVIRSRPLKSLPWQYYFYTEVEAGLAATAWEKMIEALKQQCESLKVLGSYHVNARL